MIGPANLCCNITVCVSMSTFYFAVMGGAKILVNTMQYFTDVINAHFLNRYFVLASLLS